MKLEEVYKIVDVLNSMGVKEHIIFTTKEDHKELSDELDDLPNAGCTSWSNFGDKPDWNHATYEYLGGINRKSIDVFFVSPKDIFDLKPLASSTQEITGEKVEYGNWTEKDKPTIDQLTSRKDEMVSKIKDLVSEFEKETGAQVTGLKPDEIGFHIDIDLLSL